MPSEDVLLNIRRRHPPYMLASARQALLRQNSAGFRRHHREDRRPRPWGRYKACEVLRCGVGVHPTVDLCVVLMVAVTFGEVCYFVDPLSACSGCAPSA